MRIGGLLVATIGIAAAGGVASGGGGNPQPVSFEADVQPIFDENCVTCHQSAGAPQGLVLEDGKSWRSLLQGRSAESKLALVAPGKPEERHRTKLRSCNAGLQPVHPTTDSWRLGSGA